MIGELTRYRRYIAGAMVLTGDRIVMNMINSFLGRMLQLCGMIEN